MRKWRSILVLRIAIALLGTGQALAETDPAKRIAADFADLAGSHENALAIVRGMKTGKVIAIRETSPELGNRIHAFNTVEGPLSWSDVESALASVETSFARQGVTAPTASQLRAALVPGITEAPRVAQKSETGLPRTVSAASTAPPQGERPLVASKWGRYRPSQGPSNRLEKFPGVN